MSITRTRTETTASVATAGTVVITAICRYCHREVTATPKCAVRKDGGSGITVVGQFDWYHTGSGEEECQA